MVCRVELDGLGEFLTERVLVRGTSGTLRVYLHSSLKVFGGEGLVSLCLKGVGHG